MTFVKKYDVLRGNSSTYKVLDYARGGGFGKVFKGADKQTNMSVELRFHTCVNPQEMKMLHAIRNLDLEKCSIMRLIEGFQLKNLSCLAFEQLDKSLWDLMLEREMTPLNLNQIRPIASQLLMALHALKGLGIIYLDLKPENVLLVDHEHQPFRVKLANFSQAQFQCDVQLGTSLQPHSFRAPEVTLGLPISEAIDMWGLGCLLAFLYFGTYLFNGKCPYNSMKSMCRLLGQPGDHLLNAAKHTEQYFSWEDSNQPGWRLHTPDKYLEVTGTKAVLESRRLDMVASLTDAVSRSHKNIHAAQWKDKMEFLDLLKWLLNVDAGRRATPKQALNHPFITMDFLDDGVFTSSYVEAAQKLMVVVPQNDDDTSGESLAKDSRDMTSTNYCTPKAPEQRDNLKTEALSDNGLTKDTSTGVQVENQVNDTSGDSLAKESRYVTSTNHYILKAPEQEDLLKSEASSGQHLTTNTSSGVPVEQPVNDISGETLAKDSRDVTSTHHCAPIAPERRDDPQSEIPSHQDLTPNTSSGPQAELSESSQAVSPHEVDITLKPSQGSESGPMQDTEETRDTESDTTCLFHEKCLNYSVIDDLLKELMKTMPQKSKVFCQEELDFLTEHVSNHTLGRISALMVSAKRQSKDLSKVINAVTKDLIRLIDSQEKLHVLVLRTEGAYLAFVAGHFLELRLSQVLAAPPQPSRIRRMFSALGRALAKPFSGCSPVKL